MQDLKSCVFTDVRVQVPSGVHRKPLMFMRGFFVFIPFINKFCAALPHYKIDPALRPTSKICLFLTKSKKISLTELQEERIIETCLDRLIDTDLAATAAYSMRALYQLGKKHDWVNDELRAILSRDFSNQTPGYRFAVKDILKRLK